MAVGLVTVIISGCAGSTATAAAPIGGATMDEQLLAAAATGDVAAISAALDGGADVDARDARGRTALLVATAAGQTEAVRRVLEFEPDVDLQYAQLYNPFLYLDT